MRHRKIASESITAFSLTLLLASGPCLAQKYSVATLSPLLAGANASASGMNNAGVAVGSADDVNGNPQAVKWVGSSPAQLSYSAFPGSTSGAVAINNNDVVIGDFQTLFAGVFEIGPHVDADQEIDRGINVFSISDSNVIVGEIEFHPFIWAGEDVSQNPNSSLPTTANNQGVSADGTGINTAGVIVGTEYDFLPDYSDTYPVAVRWTPDPTAGGLVVQALSGLGGRDSSASSVNASGWISGWASLGNKRMHAVLWGPRTGAFDLGTLGGNESVASGINAEGDVAGEAQNLYGQWRATVWTHKHHKAIDLNLEIDPSIAKHYTLTWAPTTNDRCQVLANGFNNKTGVQVAFVLSLTDQADCDQP